MSEGATLPVELVGDARLQRNGAVRFEPMDDGCALYDHGTGKVYILNLVAGSIGRASSFACRVDQRVTEAQHDE